MLEKIDKRRKYQLDINNFLIESREKYYWLGFLAADGNVALKEPRIRFELKIDDEDAILKLANFCKTNMPIKYRVNNNKTSCACLDINSSKLKKYLANYNIIPNKSKNFEIPLDKIPKEYLWDFVRGMMDGDGSIIFLKTKKYNPYGISFVSANYNCIKQMKEIWGLPEDHAITETNGSYVISKYGKGCISILNKIYENSTENSRLNRKYERYRSIIEQSIM